MSPDEPCACGGIISVLGLPFGPVAIGSTAALLIAAAVYVHGQTAGHLLWRIRQQVAAARSTPIHVPDRAELLRERSVRADLCELAAVGAPESESELRSAWGDR